MSVRELRATIVSAGLSHVDCTEKSELRERAVQALERLEQKDQKQSSSSNSTPGYINTTATLGGYECSIRAKSGKIDAVVIIWHGLGATNSDFATIPEILEQACSGLSSKNLAFVFPQAPVIGSQTMWVSVYLCITDTDYNTYLYRI